MNRPAELDQVLARLRERFAATAGGTLEAFEALADRLQRTPASPDVVDALRHQLHRLHGTAGSYGFHEASRLAAAFELLSSRWQSDAQRDRERRATIVRRFVHALSTAFHAAPRSSAPTVPHRMLLVDLDDECVVRLVAEALHRGHAVERTSSAGLEAILGQGLPQVIIIAAGAAFPSVPDTVPVVMLSTGDGPLAPRSAGVRQLDPATDPREVILVAESMAAHIGRAGATMLAMGDDPATLDALRTVGASEGMCVRTATTAERLMDELETDPPAMLVIDGQLPGIDAVAAMRRVRADHRFAALPIVFVSASLDAALRAAAIAAGADDVQSKPVVAAELAGRIARLLEARRQRQGVRGDPPAT